MNGQLRAVMVWFAIGLWAIIVSALCIGAIIASPRANAIPCDYSDPYSWNWARASVECPNGTFDSGTHGASPMNPYGGFCTNSHPCESHYTWRGRS